MQFIHPEDRSSTKWTIHDLLKGWKPKQFSNWEPINLIDYATEGELNCFVANPID
jgi:hypothetical protein